MNVLPARQLQTYAVNNVCVCNYEATEIFFEIENFLKDYSSGRIGVNPRSCRCLPPGSLRIVGLLRDLVCHFQVGNVNAPRTPCLGRIFIANYLSPLVGLYEYRPVQARAPVTFQYAGPATYVGEYAEPIVTVFNVVICNYVSTTPINVVVTPQALNHPQNVWSVSGQHFVSSGGDHKCTSLDPRQLLQHAREGQTLYCSIVDVNGRMATCGARLGHRFWTYSPSSTVTGLVGCGGGQVPICSVTRRYDWLRSPVQQ